MRALAAAMPDQHQSILMTDLTEDYVKLADKAALRAKGAAPKKPRPSRVLWALGLTPFLLR